MSACCPPRPACRRTHGRVCVLVSPRAAALVCAVACALACLFALPALALAGELSAQAGGGSEGSACSLTVTLLDHATSQPVAGGEVTLEAQGSDGYIVLEAQEVASDGRVAFANLEPGTYRVVQTRESVGYYPFDPFEVTLPMVGADGLGPVYDVCASPKVESRPDVPAARTTLAVTKVWAELPAGETRADGTQAAGPTSAHDPVTVDLLKDGTLYASARLDAGSGWSHVWEGLDADASWSVEESQVPDGYAASYAVSGSAAEGWNVTVTNTELAQRLIQTGQLRWPIPVLAGAGVALFAAGWLVSRRAGGAGAAADGAADIEMRDGR